MNKLEEIKILFRSDNGSVYSVSLINNDHLINNSCKCQSQILFIIDFCIIKGVPGVTLGTPFINASN